MQDEVCFFFSMHGIKLKFLVKKLKYFKETEISSKEIEISESMV